MNISTQASVLFNNLNTSRSSSALIDSQGNAYEVVDSNEKNQLDSNAFLKMLLKQMELQDPLSPMNDAEYIGQMTSFSILEQLTSISSKLDSIGNALLQLSSNNETSSDTSSSKDNSSDVSSNNDSTYNLSRSISNTNLISNNSSATNYILNKLYSNSF